MSKGKFIVLEGGEGAGKSTILQFLRESLDCEKFIFTREPGGTVFAEKIRALFLAEDHEPLDPLAELLLVNAARMQHLVHVIRPALESGMHVVCDRFDVSTYAYQISLSGAQHLEGAFMDLRRHVCGLTVPDLVMLIDVPPEVGFARKIEQAKKHGQDLTRFDGMDLSRHQEVRESMLRYIRRYYPLLNNGWGHVVVDGGGDVELVCATILQKIKLFTSTR